MTPGKKVKYCQNCVMPFFSATPIEFDEDGVCSGCRIATQKSKIDWDRRAHHLQRLLAQYRNNDDSNYDCIIPVSGGKDSYSQVHLIKNVYKMNPLLVTYNANNWTKTGYENLHNMRDVFGCDHIFFTPSIDLLKRMNRIGFTMTGDMNWHGHSGIFTYPFIVAVEKKISLIFYGEHGFMDLGGMHSYNDYIEFTQRHRLEHCLRGYDWQNFLGHPHRDEIKEKELLSFKFPTDEDIRKVGIRGIFLSNYVEWSGNNNARIAMQHGFKENDVEFDRTYRKISNLDDMHENGIHDYMKYIKFGYGRATDHTTKDIRDGILTRKQGVDIVMKRDHIKPTDLRRWLDYVDMSEEEFDSVADTFRDPRVWWIEDGKWCKENVNGESSSYESVKLSPDKWCNFQREQQ